MPKLRSRRPTGLRPSDPRRHAVRRGGSQRSPSGLQTLPRQAVEASRLKLPVLAVEASRLKRRDQAVMYHRKR